MRLPMFVALFALTACGGGETDTSDTTETDTTTFDDAALTADLWTAIDGYDTWGRPAGWAATPVLSANHMGAYVIRYDDATLAAWSGTGEAPDGAISVKEEYSDEAGTTLTGITVMQKVAGYDPDHGDWFWAKYMPDGTVGMSGKVDMCYGCHAAAPQDYLHTEAPSGM